MKTLNIHDIEYTPSDRIRQEVRGKDGLLPVESLAQSLKHFGQLLPIIVKPLENGRFQLVDGERRLTAAKSLHWETIQAVEKDASPEEMEAFEIITTIEREAFSWQEEVRSKAHLHELMCKLFGRSTTNLKIPGGWTLDNTARVLNQHKAHLSREIQLAKALDTLPELNEKQNKTAAFKFLRRHADFALREILAKESKGGPAWELREGDCVQVLRATQPDESVDLVLTDPPFGILDDNDMSWRDWRQGQWVYADSAVDYVNMMQSFVQEAFRVLKPGRHMYVFCGWEYSEALKQWCRDVGFATPGPPGIWVRRGRVKYTHMDRFATDYYSIVFAAKPYPDAKNFKWQEMSKFQVACIDGISPVTAEKKHPAEAPVDLFKLLVELSSREGELVLDPFCGSGASGEASLLLKRRYVGIDVEHNWINLSRLRLDALEY